MLSSNYQSMNKRATKQQQHKHHQAVVHSATTTVSPMKCCIYNTDDANNRNNRLIALLQHSLIMELNLYIYGLQPRPRTLPKQLYIMGNWQEREMSTPFGSH